MSNTRTKNVTLIAVTSVFRQLLNLITQFLSRTIFIYVLGAEYLGLNGLFSNILSMLSLAELGIGSAMSFYLYKPIAENDKERIKSLLSFYKLCYRVIGLSMIGVGILICPFLPYLVNFKQNLPINLYLVYILYLLNSAVTYLVYAYKQALLMANQEQYKIESINIIFVVVNCIADVFVLIVFKQYLMYLLAKLILAIIKNLTIARRIDKEYPYVNEKDTTGLKREEIVWFFRDLKNVAIFKVGSTLYNCTDNIIISKLLGTVIVGYYSNYYLIISSVTTFVGLIVKSFTAGIGNLIVREDKEKQYSYFKQIDYIAYIVVSVSTIALFQLLNSFIKLWVGGVDNNYILPQVVVLFLCMSFYLDGTTQIMNIFREASGNFGIGRNYQVMGGVTNIVLSIILGEKYGLEGIFASTVICKFLVSLFPFMIKISQKVFDMKMFTILWRYVVGMIVTMITGMVVWIVNRRIHMTTIVGFVIESISTVVISMAIIVVAYWKTEESKQNLSRMMNLIINRRDRKNEK